MPADNEVFITLPKILLLAHVPLQINYLKKDGISPGYISVSIITIITLITTL